MNQMQMLANLMAKNWAMTKISGERYRIMWNDHLGKFTVDDYLDGSFPDEDFPFLSSAIERFYELENEL